MNKLFLVLLISLSTFLYIPYNTVTPPVYHDDFLLMQAGDSVANGKGLLLPINSSPFNDRDILGSDNKVYGCFRAGYFILQGIFYKIFSATITNARLFSAIFGIAYILILYFIFKMIFKPATAFFASVLSSLDPNMWLAARTVRPDCLTAFLGILSIYLLIKSLNKQGKIFPIFLGGLFSGLAVTVHSNFAVYIPAILLIIFIYLRRNKRKEVLAGLLGAAIPAIPYVVYILLNWHSVASTIQTHSMQMSSIPKGIAWLVSPYYNAYFQKAHLLTGILLSLSAVSMVLIIFEKTRKALFACFLAITMMLVFLLFIPGKSSIYLIYIYPWLYLFVAYLIFKVFEFIKFHPEKVTTALAAVYLIYASSLYASDYSSCRNVINYEELSSRLASYISRDSILISSGNGWPVAVKSSSTFISNQMYLLEGEQFKYFPWQIERDGSHLLKYKIDPVLLSRLADKTGRQIYYLVDEYDWGWNAYYPFGVKYSASYSELQEGLDVYFKPVAQFFTRDRGMVILYKYTKDNMIPDVFYEQTRLSNRTKNILTMLNTVLSPDMFNKLTRQRDIVTIRHIKGRILRIKMDFACLDGGQFFFCFQRTGYRRYFDNMTPLRFEYYMQADESDLLISLYMLSRDGRIKIDKLEIDEVA